MEFPSPALLARERPETRSLILTTFGRPGYMRRALAEGASGFLLKDAPASELAEAIRTVAAGGFAVDPTLAAAAIREGESPLTPREHEALAAAASHDTAADIAAELYLSEGTVRNYLSAAIRKLHVRNRREAGERKGMAMTGAQGVHDPRAPRDRPGDPRLVTSAAAQPGSPTATMPCS
jgi:two-component system response regulator DesR